MWVSRLRSFGRGFVGACCGWPLAGVELLGGGGIELYIIFHLYWARVVPGITLDPLCFSLGCQCFGGLGSYHPAAGVGVVWV